MGIQLLRLHLGKKGGGPSKFERMKTGRRGFYIDANVNI